MRPRFLICAALGGLAAWAFIACGARSELPVPDLCGGEATAVAELAPLDIALMIDNSGSMSLTTPSGQTRHQAVLDAFTAFFAQPDAEGLSVSVSFFPIIDETVPEACEDDATCGMEGACQPFFACLPGGGGVCRTDEDCAAAGFPDDVCDQLGFCGDGTTVCSVSGGSCASGPCLPLSHCDNRYTCDAGGYVTPVLPMTELPAGASAVLGALGALAPEGSTPSLPALGGVIEQARAHAAAHPERNTIVLFATDGLPTACDPELQSGDPELAIEHLATTAAEGLGAGIRTFVIGLATPTDGGAHDDLDAIAAAGGTERALLVDAEVAVQLADALALVRIDASACEFVLAFDDPTISYRQVRVRLRLADSEPFVDWVPAADACGPEGGFYYDPPLEQGPPERLVLCPASCDAFGRALERNIQVLTDCPDAGSGRPGTNADPQ